MPHEGIQALQAYVADELPHLRLRYRDEVPWQQTVNLTFQDPMTGRQYLLEVHENFYLDRDAERIRQVLAAWDVAGAIRHGGARKLRIRKESFEVIDRYA